MSATVGGLKAAWVFFCIYRKPGVSWVVTLHFAHVFCGMVWCMVWWERWRCVDTSGFTKLPSQDLSDNDINNFRCNEGAELS